MLSKYDIGHEDAKGMPLDPADVQNGRLAKRPSGPQFEDVVRAVEIQTQQGPAIFGKINMAEEAATQTVALRHIATSLNQMVDVYQAQEARKQYLTEKIAEWAVGLSFWFKMACLIHVLTVIAAATMLVGR